MGGYVGDRRWIARGAQPGTVVEILVWAVPAGIIGARIYHLLPRLQAGGVKVFEVNRADRANRRRKGKSDPSMPKLRPGLSCPGKPQPSRRTAKAQ